MRELKYRFWNEKAKSYNAGRYMIGDDGNIYDVSSGDAYEWHITNDVIPEEYTGLKDKNGKEIYEGDIVKGEWLYGKDEHIVKYVGYGFYPFTVTDFDGDPMIRDVDVEIIGNIHENPELMEYK